MARKPTRRSEEWAPELPEDPPSEPEGEGGASLEGLEGAPLREALEARTVPDLRAHAKTWSVNLQGKRRKADLIDLLVAARGGDIAPPAQSDEAQAPHDVPQDFDLPFGQLDDLWIEAANCVDRGDYRSAIALSRDALNVVGSWTRTYMEGMCARALLAARSLASRYEEGEASPALHGKIDEARRAYERGDLKACAQQIGELQREIADVHMREVGRLQEILTDRQGALRELEGLRTDATEAQALLVQAEEASTLDEHERALDLVHQFDTLAERTKDRRMEELRDYLAAVESRIEETEALGSSLKGARKLVNQARAALDRNELVLCDEIARRCEAAVLEAQRSHIEGAMKMRREYFRQVREQVARLKPTLKEASAYGIDIEALKALLRESLNLLRRDAYLEALAKAEAAQRAMEALLPEIVAKREGRGVAKPEGGACRACDSHDVEFADDGWAECLACGHRFRWRTREPPRLLKLLRRRLAR